MIPKECKRIAEVDFPIAAVSKHAVREKSIRHGHPSTLHLWWARRPLASSRAVLLALLLPDPCDSHCPGLFKEEARRVLLKWHIRPQQWKTTIVSDAGLRRAILKFIADFSNWKNAADISFLKVSRALVKAAHGDASPLVVDPFSGGGSIPLEAMRLGCEAFASDLNPVACLILKVMLEDIPRYGPKLAEELHGVGAEIKYKAEQELAHLYPADSDSSTPIAYLWARTVRCESPKCGAEIPLMRTFWLCKKAKRKRALRYFIERPDGLPPRVKFEIFEPELDTDVPVATVARAKATCICCNAVLPPERVRVQLAAHKGGADVVFDGEGRRVGGARMIAVVTLRSGQKGRHYRLPIDEDYVVVREAQERVARILNDWECGGIHGLCPVPDEPLPLMSGTFNVPLYGIRKWGDLFTARQKVALMELSKGLGVIRNSFGAQQSLISLLLGKMADGNNSLARWESGAENPVNLFSRQAIPMVWDFCESTPKSNARGVFLSSLNTACKVIENIQTGASGQVQQADAMNHPLPDQSASIWFTDPPYYFAIPYADLSDFFFVWLKRALPNNPLIQDPFDPNNNLTPKGPELCEMAHWDPERYSHKDHRFFEDGMTRAFAEGHRILREDGVGSVVFAHKTTEGWEALLSGMIRGGWTITGSWPIATESPSRLRARESAALATSVHLICRPRPKDALIGDWADVLRELPGRVRRWMEHLQGEGIRGADLVFACVGPALEIFSRYRVVETAEGREVTLPEYLRKVWEVVGRTALEQILGTTGSSAGGNLTGALEEDARLTALFLWTLQSTKTTNDDGAAGNAEISGKTKTKGFSLPFDVVRRFAQPMGIDLNAWSGSIISQKKGVVRLLPVTERIKDLFGEDGASSAAEWIQIDSQRNIQGELFAEQNTETTPNKSRKRKRKLGDDVEFEANNVTALDCVHAAMLFQASGHASALRKLIEAELGRGPEFLRLANALSALYPRESQEKRLLDAMLLAVPR